jgi:hippurate hydrolase
MEPNLLLQEAQELQSELVQIRHELHEHPELGFDMVFTKPYVKSRLEQMGYEVCELGKAGLVATIGAKNSGRTILLRSDMDALPIQEEADVDYKSKTNGKMHACGHDMHTAMLLGAARLLKQHENEIAGTVKLEFQPAEEIFQGSEDMIENGLLENPIVDAAFMLHVVAGVPMPSGMLMIPGGGISTASCEQYHITVTGKSGHGSMPDMSIDAITAAAQIHLALQEINSREITPGEYAVLTTCRFQAGNTSNVFPETAQMWGTIRTMDPQGRVGEQIKQRMSEISGGIASAMRCRAEVSFSDFCPSMIIDDKLAEDTLNIMQELDKEAVVNMSEITGNKKGGGSEDFAFVSHKVPAVSLYITAGSINEGYIYGQHNSKVRFDDSVLYKGSAVYAYMALRWLQQNQ